MCEVYERYRLFRLSWENRFPGNAPYWSQPLLKEAWGPAEDTSEESSAAAAPALLKKCLWSELNPYFPLDLAFCDHLLALAEGKELERLRF